MFIKLPEVIGFTTPVFVNSAHILYFSPALGGRRKTHTAITLRSRELEAAIPFNKFAEMICDEGLAIGPGGD